MQVLERCMMEALRLFPPLIMLLRQAKATFAVTTSQGKTHIIPKVCAPAQLSKPAPRTGNLAAECNALRPARLLGTLQLILLCLQLSRQHILTDMRSLHPDVP